ncbi:hypothetical protein A5624_22530 [Mycobacterium sp. 1482292.6]|nr:hypothetical protein A5624_22530 [Mycobacterium sp. 1482292.6]
MLQKMGQSVTSRIIDGWNSIFRHTSNAQEVAITADLDTDLPDSPPYLELKIKGPEGIYDLSERSLGFRWFFMFLLMTSFHGDPASNRKALFLLDEPASNLHSSAQAQLLKSFERLLDRCALIYTTHSHHLINVKWLDSALVVKNAALGSFDLDDYLSVRTGADTSVSAIPYRQFVANHPDQQSYFQPVLDLLEYTPSSLEPVPEVVLVEGKSDFYLLRYMIDVIGVRGDLKTVPGGGAGSLEPLIRLHIGWGKSFIILLDGDKEGRDQMERYHEEFGPMVRDRCVLLPEACDAKTAIEAEKLLSTSDFDTILDAIYPAGSPRPARKKALRNAVMELLAAKRAVAIEQSTIRRFETLIANLNERLTAL